ncbi:MetQ/NlpA family ABC transporter substrate-binding protein [Cupriavidus neocaledonicus]|uniref:Lipoprotein n=1 Tax=Cupriavidus neocaledonicus TaxID=1040979 RepID=A0A375HNA4_9BURK|nr:MetQ/NlpA family ABC transporter substrate-binding protein [Cupriavidus neocaledonicus]SOZ39380.1 putative NLPA lipoprotein [Cupriavidus neocaledonicus]SPD58905.1 Lipoprotein [Cupriavidus neocaledonicus]
MQYGKFGLAARLAAAVLALGVVQGAGAADPDKKEIRFGATAGPYADQIRYGVKPVLEQRGYKVTIVEFSDYVQPNLALADGAIDANAFQHVAYLKKFSADRKLALSDVIQVPTAPIGIYSRKHKALAEVKAGNTVSLPNDPTNLARAIAILQQIGWVTLKPGTDPIRASERDIDTNPHKLKLVQLEAAQLPRSLDDVDYAFVNGNYALASGLKLTSALALEKIPDYYMNLVAVKTADLNKPFVRDIREAYQSAEFKAVTQQRFAGFVPPPYQR